METRSLLYTGSLADVSVDVNNYYSGNTTIAMDDSSYFYIGQRHPFNHIFIKMYSKNSTSATLSIDLWDGGEWISTADILDETDCFSKSGLISWTPDNQESWSVDDTIDSQGNEEVTGLGDVKIYRRYWARLSVNTTISTSTSIAWIGNIFNTDNDLFAEYPEFITSSYLKAWSSSKTDWEEQRVRAAQKVIADLIRRNVIDYKGQIIEKEELMLAANYATAEIIFNALGDDYENERVKAMSKYSSEISKGIFRVDKNRDALMSKHESEVRPGRIHR